MPEIGVRLVFATLVAAAGSWAANPPPAAQPAAASDTASTTTPADSILSLPDSTLDLATRIDAIDERALDLAPAERRVLDELLAAAREMYADGDIEATELLVQDAVDLVGKKAR